MSQASISSTFELAAPAQTQEFSKPLKVLIVGDFSGQGSFDRAPVPNPAKVTPAIHKVDKDNFDQVFSELAVKFKPQLGEEVISFNEIDALQPDYLFELTSVFDPLRSCLSKIKRCKSYEDALKHVYLLASQFELSAITKPRALAADETPVSLDEVLLATQPPVEQASITSLISKWLEPIKLTKADPGIADLEDVVTELIGNSLRELLHDPEFKRLESLWRALALVNREADTDRHIQLHILNMLDRDALGLFAQEGNYLTQFQALIDSVKNSPVPLNFDVIVFNAFSCAENQTPQQLMRVATLANELNALILTDFDLAYWAGGNTENTIDTFTSESVDLQPSAAKGAAWSAYKQVLAEQKHLLIAPKLLLRLPYGRNTKPIDSIAFEEIPAGVDAQSIPKSLLWGSGAILGLLVLEDIYFEGSDKVVACLPFYVRKQGLHEYVQPPVEYLLNKNIIERLKSDGLCFWLGQTDSSEITLI